MQVAVRGHVERQEPNSSDLGRLLDLGGEGYDDDAASEHRHEGASLHHWIDPRVSVLRVRRQGMRGVVKPARVHAGTLLTGWAECSRAEVPASRDALMNN